MSRLRLHRSTSVSLSDTSPMRSRKPPNALPDSVRIVDHTETMRRNERRMRDVLLTADSLRARELGVDGLPEVQSRGIRLVGLSGLSGGRQRPGKPGLDVG